MSDGSGFGIAPLGGDPALLHEGNGIRGNGLLFFCGMLCDEFVMLSVFTPAKVGAERCPFATKHFSTRTFQFMVPARRDTRFGSTGCVNNAYFVDGFASLAVTLETIDF